MNLQIVKSTLAPGVFYGAPPAGLEWRSNTFFIIATVGVGLFTDLFLYGLVVPILPFLLQDRVGIPTAEVQPHVSALLAAYAGASVIFSPIAGVIADKTSSRQMPFLAGLFALLGATIMLYLGQTEAVLAIARVLQGVSAAVVWTIGLALLLDTVGPENLGKTIGSIFSFVSVGTLIAPVVGGVLYKKSGYAGVFGVGAGLVAVDFIMRLLLIEKKVAARYRSVKDYGRSNENGEERDQGEEDGNGEEEPLLGGQEKDYYEIPPNQPSWLRKVPLVYCFRNPALLTAFLVAFVQAGLLGTFDATVTTEAEALFGFDSLSSGLLFVPLGVGDLLVGPLAGWAVDRYGTKPVGVIGYGVLVPFLISLRAVHSGGKSELIKYCALLTLNGAGLASIGAPSIVEAGAVVKAYNDANPDFFGENGPYAQLYGMNSMVFSAGLTLGPLVGGGLREAIGYGNMNAVMAVISGITAVLCYLFIGGRRRILQKRSI